MTAKSQIHTHKHVAYHGFGDMLVVAVDSSDEKPPSRPGKPSSVSHHAKFMSSALSISEMWRDFGETLVEREEEWSEGRQRERGNW